MRAPTTSGNVQRLIDFLGARAGGPGKVYLVGGATAVMTGWRTSTKDVDLKLDPEPAGIFEAIRDAKEELQMNIELASPDLFLPPVPGWEDRSRFICQRKSVEFYHYDPVGQCLAKIARGHDQDLSDVRAMIAHGWLVADDIRQGFNAIKPGLLRYPALNESILCDKVDSFLESL